MPPTPTEQFSSFDGHRASITYRVAWEHRVPFLATLLGFARVTSGRLSRVVPHLYLPSQEVIYEGSYIKLYCTRASVKGISRNADPDKFDTDGKPWGRPYHNADGDVVYHLAEIVAEYESVNYFTGDDAEMNNYKESEFFPEWSRFCIVEQIPAGEFFTALPGYFKWDSDQKVLNTPGVTLPDQRCGLAVTWLGVPTIPAKLYTYMGTVNKVDNTFRRLLNPAHAGFEKESLMYEYFAPKKKYVNMYGTVCHDLTLFFTHRPNKFNRLRRFLPNGTSTTYDYEAFSVRGDSADETDENKVLKLRDLRELFQP